MPILNNTTPVNAIATVPATGLDQWLQPMMTSVSNAGTNLYNTASTAAQPYVPSLVNLGVGAGVGYGVSKGAQQLYGNPGGGAQDARDAVNTVAGAVGSYYGGPIGSAVASSVSSAITGMIGNKKPKSKVSNFFLELDNKGGQDTFRTAIAGGEDGTKADTVSKAYKTYYDGLIKSGFNPQWNLAVTGGYDSLHSNTSNGFFIRSGNEANVNTNYGLDPNDSVSMIDAFTNATRDELKATGRLNDETQKALDTYSNTAKAQFAKDAETNRYKTNNIMAGTAPTIQGRLSKPSITFDEVRKKFEAAQQQGKA